MSVIDQENLKEIKAVMKDKFPIMIEIFIEDTVKYMSGIEEGIKEWDLTKISSFSHTIKSSSRQIGATKVSDISEKIESLSLSEDVTKEDNKEEFVNLQSSLKKAFEEAKTELQKILDEG